MIKPQWASAGLFNSYGLAQVYLSYEGYNLENLQVIDTSGRYLVPYESIQEFAMKHFHFQPYFEMLIYDSIIKVVMGETSVIEYNKKGQMLYAFSEYSPNQFVDRYNNAFNRQVMMTYNKKHKFYFTDHYLNRTSPDFDEIAEEDDFGKYYLYRLESKDGLRDSTALNPEGPSAWIRNGKFTILVDSNFNILYKYNRKYPPDINTYKHPKMVLDVNKQSETLPYPCIQINMHWDSLANCAYFNGAGRQITPFIYDFYSNFWVYRYQACNIPIIVVKQNGLYSFIDTSGTLLMPFRYKELTPYNGRYALAQDSCWHWIKKNGELYSPNQYIKIEKFNGEFGKGYDTAWHYTDESGFIILEKLCRKGFEIVKGSRCTLLFDPRRNIYIDYYGREYFE